MPFGTPKTKDKKGRFGIEAALNVIQYDEMDYFRS
jgi:hypothetical protein